MGRVGEIGAGSAAVDEAGVITRREEVILGLDEIIALDNTVTDTIVEDGD